MSEKNKTKEHPLGGWFGTIGAVIGLIFGFDITASWIGAVIGLFIGAYIGIAVEHVVAKLLIFIGAILIFLARREILGAIIDSIINQ